MASTPCLHPWHVLFKFQQTTPSIQFHDPTIAHSPTTNINSQSAVKITSSSIYIYTKSSSAPSSIGLQIAIQILYSIALGPLLGATISFITVSINGNEKRLKPQCPQARGKPLLYLRSLSTDLSRILRLMHLVIIVALVLGIVGGIDRAPSSSTGKINAGKYDKGATLLKASAVLFLVAFLAGMYVVTTLWRHRPTIREPSRTIVSSMAAVLPLILVRVIYSLLIDFHLDTTGSSGHTDRYNMLTGSWVIYLFLGLLSQVLVVVVCIVAGVVGGKRAGKMLKSEERLLKF